MSWVAKTSAGRAKKDWGEMVWELLGGRGGYGGGLRAGYLT